MKTVNFNPNGGPLSARALFSPHQIMVANYEMFLREKDSNTSTSLLVGDNLNPEDDTSFLPIPCVINDGRRVILETGFVGMNVDDYKNYLIRLEIWQDGQCIGFEEEDGTLTGKGQYSLLFIKLIAEQSTQTVI